MMSKGKLLPSTHLQDVRTACYLCQVRGANHPQLEDLQQRSVKILAGAAGAQGIETEEAFDTWFE